ncbi:MAG: hypothetical protein QOH61_3 [Chloroflexota bacterium]|jgi:hypothetical protein|nr:hypothetical protein [Chloroflexota bacterium]
MANGDARGSDPEDDRDDNADGTGPGPADGEVLAQRPRARRPPSTGSSTFGQTIGGVMHGIDADIFRDPASIQRIQRDQKQILRAADGTMVGIEMPGDEVLVPDEENASEEVEP